jgi:ubiquitin-associated SH3 domain-containing protein
MSNLNSRKIVILRHGERVDYLFGEDWYQYNFKNGVYKKSDLNMPDSLPARSEDEWKLDSPLTATGAYQARLLGSSFKEHGVDFKHAYCSPAFRCIQTCHEILTGNL